MSAWTYRLEGFVAGEEGRRESLCTLGNGYLATRGAMPESTADGAHYPGTYVAGTYNRLADVVDGQRIVNESLVNLPNWLVTALRIDGGAWLDLARDEVLEHWQQLDLREGILLRHTRLRDPAGRTTRIVQRRLVSMDRPHVAALETTVTAEDWSGRLTVRSGLDGTVAQRGRGPLPRPGRDAPFAREQPVPRRRDGPAAWWRPRSRASGWPRPRGRGSLLRSATDAVREVVRERGWVGHDISVELSPGQDVTLEKVVAIFTSRDRAISEPAEAAVEELAAVRRRSTGCGSGTRRRGPRCGGHGGWSCRSTTGRSA